MLIYLETRLIDNFSQQVISYICPTRKLTSLDPSRLRAHLALFAVALIYGMNYSIAKDVMPDYLGPRGFILVRALGGVILFWLTAFIWNNEKTALKDHLLFFVCGVFGVAGNQLTFFEGLNITTPINAAVMMTVNPILVLLLSALILKEGLRMARIIGIVLGIAGAIMLITRGGAEVDIFASDKSLGNFLVFLNASSYAMYLILVKPLMRKYAPITVIRWVFTYGLLVVIPFGYEQMSEIRWIHLPDGIILRIAFVVIGTTYFAYLLNVFALKTVSSTTVSFYIYLQPLIAAIVAIVLGKDHLTPVLVMAAVLIFAGVYLVSFFGRNMGRSR